MNLMSFDYDLFVIGGGSGGVRAARVAAALEGKRVALAEMDRYGGTCVIRGCVPKKLMVFASEFASIFAESREYGWDLPKDNGLNWTQFSGKLSNEVSRLEHIYRNLLKNSGVKTFDQHAKVVDEHTVELESGECLTARYILLATGGKPDLPNIPGIEHVLTSDQIFSLTDLPKTMLIVGGGYIACEFASIFNGFGCKITQFCRSETILRGFDSETTAVVADQMKSNGIDLKFNINVSSVEKHKDGFQIKDTNGRAQFFDQILFATGRVPNSHGLQNKSTGLLLGSRGEVVVDDYSQSSLKSIYAIGDLTDRTSLTPIAIKEAMAFVETIFHNNPTNLDYASVPTAVFTKPEMGTVGLSEEVADKCGPIDIFTTYFRPMKTSFADNDDKSFIKLIVCKKTDKVLGVHIVAPGAGEMVQMVAIALKMGATKKDFDSTLAVHPTISEEIVTMQKPTRSS